MVKKKIKTMGLLRWLNFPMTFVEIGILFGFSFFILSLDKGFSGVCISYFIVLLAGWRMLKFKTGKEEI